MATSQIPISHTKKLSTRISNYFSPEITFIWACDFYRYEHFYTKEIDFKTFLTEIYVIACYIFSKEMFENEIEHGVDSAYGIFI